MGDCALMRHTATIIDVFNRVKTVFLKHAEGTLLFGIDPLEILNINIM